MFFILEIRFHGRGGQGAKTAAAFIAEAAQREGKFVQSFPEYGAERQGAPVTAFTRISDSRIYLHCGITEPDIVVVVDPTLLKSIPVAEGLKENGMLVVNTVEPIEKVREHTGFNGKIITVDATKIAVEEIGKAVTNTAMLGALEKAKEIVPFEHLLEITREHFTYKLGEDVAERNVKALKRAYEEAKVW
ncbi:pyruvate synthase [Candidatus Woesearchaeota archaeon]|nr:MAG: pyruvate synthase [Candidatus Woesearchaeota archaeon]